MRALKTCLGFILMGCLSGCGPKLDMTATFEVPAHLNHTLTLERIKNEQTIKITGSATESPVNVYVYLAANDNQAKNEIMNKKSERFIIKKQEKTEAINLEAPIPANEEAVVLIESTGKKANVQLKITNR
jgi:hypothetical protein